MMLARRRRRRGRLRCGSLLPVLHKFLPSEE